MRKAYFIEKTEHYNSRTNELEYTDYRYWYRGYDYTITKVAGDDEPLRRQHEESQRFIDNMIETWRNPKKLILNKRKDQGVNYGVQHYRGDKQ